MILPGKYLQPERSLLVIGGEVIGLLDMPGSVSDVWSRFKEARASRCETASVTYDWFVLALTFLNAVGAIRLDGEILLREGPP